MTDVIYRVTYADGTMCHTGYKPMADVWAKRYGSKLEEIEVKNPTRLRIVNSGDSMSDCYERAFTGANRTAATWAAFQAGWNAAKPSDQAIYDSIYDRYRRDTAQPAPREGGCLMCGHCAATGEPVANPMANHAETSSSPIATVYDPYDTPGIEWHCQHPPPTGMKLYAAPAAGVLRECCAEDCEWVGYTDRMLGAVGPLCPECGEVTELSDSTSEASKPLPDLILQLHREGLGPDEIAATLSTLGRDSEADAAGISISAVIEGARGASGIDGC